MIRGPQKLCHHMEGLWLVLGWLRELPGELKNPDIWAACLKILLQVSGRGLAAVLVRMALGGFCEKCGQVWEPPPSVSPFFREATPPTLGAPLLRRE